MSLIQKQSGRKIISGQTFEMLFRFEEQRKIKGYRRVRPETTVSIFFFAVTQQLSREPDSAAAMVKVPCMTTTYMEAFKALVVSAVISIFLS